MSVVHARSQIVTVLQSEIVGITSSCRVSHVGELAATSFDISVLRLNGVLDGTRNRVVDAQDGALDELDLSSTVTLQTSSSLGLLATKPALLGIDGGCGPAISKAGIFELAATKSSLCRILVAIFGGRRLGLLGVGRSIRLGKTVGRDWAHRRCRSS